MRKVDPAVHAAGTIFPNPFIPWQFMFFKVEQKRPAIQEQKGNRKGGITDKGIGLIL